jgi:calcineurin-like phosphoesterase family protein
MATWFTADTHFGHANIIKYCKRPFANSHEMDEELIKRWNERVSPDDIVWHLGDFAFGDNYPYLRRCHGKKNLILGNHDKEKYYRGTTGWESVSRFEEITVEGTMIVLCHYGMRVWNKSHHGSLHFYGHSHGTLPGIGMSCDVGVDCWDYRPVSLTEIMDRLNK